MIDPADLYGIKHYDYGEAYYGSDNGKRFRVSRRPFENVFYKSEEEKKAQAPILVAQVWFGENAFDKTPPEDITEKEFDYTEEGYSDMIRWLNDL